MENLKAIIVFLLFWSIVIWCARIIKRKRDKQMMEFSEELPEMELVTDEEERKYICKNMVEMGKLENLFWGLVFLLNWWTIVRAIVEICQEWSNGIAYELLEMSLLIAINGVIADMAMLVWLENGENSLLPRMKPKDESNVGEE